MARLRWRRTRFRRQGDVIVSTADDITAVQDPADVTPLDMNAVVDPLRSSERQEESGSSR